MLNNTYKLTSCLCSLIMPKHCMAAVIECFLINAHHAPLFAIENSAEMKYWQQFSISKFRELSTSVTSLLSYIDISTLEQRRQSSRLVLLYKIINNLLPISIPTYYQHTQFHTRQHHTNHFVLPQATLNSYKYSFYLRTIKDWNNLPINVIEARDLDEFTYLLNVNYCNY